MADFADLTDVTLSASFIETPAAIQTPARPVSLSIMIALTAAGMSLYILYTGIGALLLPFQVSQLAPADKVTVLGTFTGIAVLVALVANPLAGALSDRTTSRFGRRRPWIFAGVLLTAVGLLFM